jgi:uncharacterized RDD family membrane protein YckC
MELASRWIRLAAALTDAVILVIPNVLMDWDALPGPVRLLFALVALGIVGADVYLLTVRGQTIAKRLFGIRIVRKDNGENGGFVTNVLLRGLVNGLLNLLPLYFLVDCGLIFREDRRCVHDMIAGTVVVAGQPGDAPEPVPAGPAAPAA